MPHLDQLGRSLRNLRLSVTDRCNLRCSYCMPEKDYLWLPREDLLDFEEICRLVDVFCSLGVSKVRLTGGEPLLRRELPELVRLLAEKPAIEDLALTTNGLMLADLARPLRSAGLHRITVSLDTLQPDRFLALTRRPSHHLVLAGIDAARVAGFTSIKLDTVLLRGENDDEILELLAFAKSIDAEIRFIEYMDVGGATRWDSTRVVSRAEILGQISAAHGEVQTWPADPSAPAERFRLRDGTTFGIIASTTSPFCAACDRSRLTADGMWYRCLYASTGTDLRAALRGGATVDEIASLITLRWHERRDQGAVDRFHVHHRQALLGPERLRDDPHLEMHTRGG